MLPLNPPRSKQTPIIHIVSSQDQNKSMLCMCELPKSKQILIKHIMNPQDQDKPHSPLVSSQDKTKPSMHVWAPKIKTDQCSPFLNSQDQKKPPICMCELPRSNRIKSPFCIFEPQYQTNPNYVCTSYQDKAPILHWEQKCWKKNARRKLMKWKKFCNF
jgi:hypothetical protein